MICVTSPWRFAIASLIGCESPDKKKDDSNLEKNVSEANTDEAEERKIPVNSESKLTDSDLNKSVSETKPTVSDKPISPTIKGLYLGMNISDANNVCGSLIKEHTASFESSCPSEWSMRIELTEVQKVNKEQEKYTYAFKKIGDLDANGSYFQIIKYLKHNEYGENDKSLLTIESDSKGKVIRIFIAFDFVKHLFNSHQITNEDFAQKFISAYKIPQLETYPIPNTALRAWRYNDPNNYNLLIIPDQYNTMGDSKWGGGDIVIETVTKENKVNFD
jgi:hypothetical protein